MPSIDGGSVTVIIRQHPYNDIDGSIRIGEDMLHQPSARLCLAPYMTAAVWSVRAVMRASYDSSSESTNTIDSKRRSVRAWQPGETGIFDK